MTDLEPLLQLWQDLRISGAEYVLGTVVLVEGSGYRKPGARILIAGDGRRAGSISGGCMEGEVARKAFWHTESGPVVMRYSSHSEDGEVPFGMGCGGVIHLLLERSATAGAVISRLARHFHTRQPLAVATVLNGARLGQRALWPPDSSGAGSLPAGEFELLEQLAQRSFEEQNSFSHILDGPDGGMTHVRVEWSRARPGLFVFGAGDDAIPLVRQARQMGWFVELADGRSNLATRARFPEANEVRVTQPGPLPQPGLRSRLRPTDAAVVMTHSLEQDTAALRALLAEDLSYIGVLGPLRRTMEILESLVKEHNLEAGQTDLLNQWIGRIHSPIGLDLGGDTPADIALAIVSEIQLCLHRRTGLPLTEIRGRSQGSPAMTPSPSARP